MTMHESVYTSWVPLDEEQKICVRCGHQELPYSEIKELRFEKVEEIRLRWFPRYGMGLCSWCFKHYPDYLYQAIEMGKLLDDVPVVAGDMVWWKGIFETQRKTKNTAATTAMIVINKEKEYFDEIAKRFGKYFVKKNVENQDAGELLHLEHNGVCPKK